MIEEKLKKQQLALRIDRSIYKNLKEISIKNNQSLNRLIIESIKNYLIVLQPDNKQNSVIKKEAEKQIEYRVRLSESEALLLKKYAQGNSWSIPKEIQYRVTGTLFDDEKISPKELEAIRGIKVSINALGNNINRIIRENRIMDKTGVEACILLSNNIDEVRNLIMKIYEQSRERFALKKIK